MSNTTISMDIPKVAPMGIPITRDAVQEVWDLWVKPEQELGNVQSVEMRILMAILRSMWAALPGEDE